MISLTLPLSTISNASLTEMFESVPKGLDIEDSIRANKVDAIIR